MIIYGCAGIPDNELDAEVVAKYGEDPEKLSIARQIGQIAGEFSNNLPKGMSPEKRKKKDYRRAARRYITEKTRERIKPVGFGGFVLMAIISGIISFFVQRLLRAYFGDDKVEEENA